MSERILDPIGMHLAFAADGMTIGQAIALARAIQGQVAIIKANDLVADKGSEAVVLNLAPFVLRGGIWIDLKTDDTDGTMINTMNKLGINGAKIASVHLFNSRNALLKAKEEAKKYNCELTGISLLSSITKEEAEKLFNRPYDTIVPWFIERAKDLGFRSFVCSATQLPEIIKLGIGNMVPIIPGTRSTTTKDKSNTNFQAETDTTENIVKILAENNIQGILVIGSEVIKAENPVRKLAEIKASIQRTLDANGLKLIPKIPLLEA